MVKYLIKDLNLVHSRDFNQHQQQTMAHLQYFIFAPMLRQNIDLFKLILD